MQSVHHAFIKLKAGDFVPADANFIPGRLVPFSRFRWSPASRWRGNLLAGWLTPSGCTAPYCFGCRFVADGILASSMTRSAWRMASRRLAATPVLPPPDLSCTVHFHRVELMS